MLMQVGREFDEDHIGAALWNIGSYIHTEQMIKEGLLPEELDDRPTPERVLGKEYYENKKELDSDVCGGCVPECSGEGC